MAEYGTVDEKKAIISDPEFHKMMVEVAKQMSIKVSTVVNPATGTNVEIAGSIDVKGIRGSDKRRYVVDMNGLTPRDANYIGDDFACCLVRPELISLY